jgi:hypothetical protein
MIYLELGFSIFTRGQVESWIYCFSKTGWGGGSAGLNFASSLVTVAGHFNFQPLDAQRNQTHARHIPKIFET